MAIWDLIPLVVTRRVMPSGGVPREVLKSDIRPGPLCVMSLMGHNSGTGGWNMFPLVVFTVSHVHLMGGV